jgi:phage I-like protein
MKLTAVNDGALVTDGVTVAAGSRILVKDQTDRTQNGIYEVTAAGDASNPFVLTRASDCDRSEELISGVRIAVAAGTSNRGVWYLSSPAPLTLDSSNLDFVRDTATSQAAQAAYDIAGDGSNAQFDFSHSFGTKDVICALYDAATDEQVAADIKLTSENDVRVTFGEAPAAGWIKELTDKGEAGLWASVEWTPRGAEYIKNKEYKYLSPVVSLDNGRASVLWSAALTNTPAIDGMEPIANKRIYAHSWAEGDNMEQLLKDLAALLGLAETATAEEIAGALKTLQEKAAEAGQQPEVVANKQVLALLDLREDAKLEDVKGAVLALKNPSGYVKAEEFARLKNKLDLKERDELVALALTSGKVAPANKDWAESYALKDPEGFKVFLHKAPAVVPLKETAAGMGQRTPPAVDGELQLSVNKALGIAPETFQKYNKEDGK